MEVCQNCGEPVQPQQAFCKNCGAKIIQQQEPSSSPVTRTSPVPSLGPSLTKKEGTDAAPELGAGVSQNNGQSSNPITSGQTRSGTVKNAAISTPMKIAIVAAVVLVIALFGAHTYLSNAFKPEKTIAQFQQAVKTKDYSTLRKILVQNGNKLDLSDKDLAAYVTFLTNDKNINLIVDDLKKNAADINAYKKAVPVADDSSNNLLMLEKGSKLLGIYQQYVINVYPFTIKAETNADNTDIYFNGKKAKTIKSSKDTVTVGKYLPGDYSLKAVFKNEYLSLNAQKKVDFTEAENNMVTTKVNLKGHFVSIYSNGDGAEIYANGKNTGKKVGDVDTFGPVPIDGSVELYAVLNRDGGPIKSAPVKITGDGEVYLEFKEIADEQRQAAAKQAAHDALNQYGSSYDTPQQKMESFMRDYLSESVYAINARDFALVESYLDPNGKQYNESKNYIGYLASKGITEDFYDLTILNVDSTDTGYQVKTREEYEIYYEDGTSKYKTFESVYSLVGDESGLKVSTLDSTKEISSSDTSEDY